MGNSFYAGHKAPDWMEDLNRRHRLHFLIFKKEVIYALAGEFQNG